VTTPQIVAAALAADPLNCRCPYFNTPCLDRATGEDGLCDSCRGRGSGGCRAWAVRK